MKLAVTKKWRNIFEMSSMSNNDEIVEYTDKKIFSKDAGYRLVLSRPVFDFEIQEGLDTTYKGRRDDWREDGPRETIPDITRFLDAYFIIKERAEGWKDIVGEKFSPTKFLSEHIASAYYDCMSGGFPLYELMICRLLVQDVSINLDNYVYPCNKEHEAETGRDHYTLLDFLNDTEDTKEQFQDKFRLLMDQFSLPMLGTRKEK